MKQSPSMQNLSRLPTPVAQYLLAYMRQRRWLLFGRELLLLLVLLSGWILLCCLVDRLAHLGFAFRLGLWLVSLLGAILWLAQLLRRTLLAGEDLTHAALGVESLRGDLAERLTTICTRLQDPAGASDEMLTEVSRQVVQLLQQDQNPHLATFRALRSHLASLTVILGMTGALSTVSLLGLPQLAQRFILPWSKVPPVTTTRLILLQSAGGAISLLQGEGIALDVLARRADEEGVLLHYSTDGKTWSTSTLPYLGFGHFQGVIGPVTGEMQLYFSSGDALYPPVKVHVRRRPAVVEFRLRYEYPPYIQHDPVTVSNTDGLIEAPVGAKATLSVIATEKLRSATIKIRDSEIALSPTVEGNVMQGMLTVRRDQDYKLDLLSDEGMLGHGPDGLRMHAIPDHPPFVRLLAPQEDMELMPRAVAAINFQALDDYGVSDLRLRLHVNGARLVFVPLKLSSDPRRCEGKEEIDLARLNLKIGDVVAVSVVARDKAGQFASSDTRLIFISPGMIDSAERQRVQELQRALLLTTDALEQLSAASRHMDEARAQRPNEMAKEAQAISKYQQNLAASGEDAAALRVSLEHALTLSHDRQRNDLLAQLADRALVRMIEAHDLADEPGKGEARETSAQQRISRAMEQTRDMRTQLAGLVEAEMASLALADQQNLDLKTNVRLPTTQATELREKKKKDYTEEVRFAGLDPQAANLNEQLQGKITAGQRLLAEAKRLDLLDAARNWAQQLDKEKIHEPMFDRRLAAAADIEALRQDGDPVKARDLNLSARAAGAIRQMASDSRPALQQAAGKAKEQFVNSFADLASTSAEKVAAARKQMAAWAGDVNSPAGPIAQNSADQASRELALQANADMAEGNYEQAAQLQQKMQLAPVQDNRATEDMAHLQEARRLQAAQEALQKQTQAADAQQAAALQQQQGQLTQQIAREDETPGLPQDTRAEAMAAIQAAQERLAQLPQQLQDATRVASRQFQAHDTAVDLAQEVQRAVDNRKPQAQVALEHAVIAENEARQDSTKALLPLAPDVAKTMSASLLDYQPETSGAIITLDKRLAPALETVGHRINQNQPAELTKAVEQARQAIAQVQEELRKAQLALLDQDPLFAAKTFAQEAARALGQNPPDIPGAAMAQQASAQALAKQAAQKMERASAARMAGIPGLQRVFSDTQASSAPVVRDPSISLQRQWGMLYERENLERSAVTHEEDVAGYQKMIQIYFSALGKARDKEEPK